MIKLSDIANTVKSGGKSGAGQENLKQSCEIAGTSTLPSQSTPRQTLHFFNCTKS